MKVIDIEGMTKEPKKKKKGALKNEHGFEILFVEKVEETQSLLIHSKDKFSLDNKSKDLMILLLEQPDSYNKMAFRQ